MYEVKMPRLGTTMKNGLISQWLVEEGQEVKKGEYLFELETEKSTLEIEAQENGVLRKIIVPEDEEVPVNTVIAILGKADEEIDFSVYSGAEKAETPSESQTQARAEKEQEEKPKAAAGGVSPRARRVAKELGVPLDGITGTGKNGIITEDDVKNAASGPGSSGLTVKETIKLNNVQRTMAENIMNSWQTIPQFTQMVTVNMSKVLEVKKEISGISMNDIIVKTVSNAVKNYPYVNSRFKDNEVTVFEEINVSVAVNSSHGLVVPVVRNTESKSIGEIASEIKELAEKAESKSLGMDDYANGTITVSNLGSLGIESGTPIINAPQSTIVFAGATRKMPVVSDSGEVEVVPVMGLSICYDHRFIDGVAGAGFTKELQKAFENLTAEDLK
ncbi:dihydrolipoamide acetyltransferase family protein [Planococcus citreus]|uniref:Dihydrolipoamide acetyltransferase component of pyruvate dehydrogenase complex n=1 Tax=Planococcus citreus TaxID=1373 RepID=A0A497YML2_9BACL|nr:dihydrolipoamide acetyltransferase family protein [Planococcus citreus]RLJ91020.1 pyruvate dehydrogenase E2 component (dihydrolipoamide acetyltransferase) [Planococcus citreus]